MQRNFLSDSRRPHQDREKAGDSLKLVRTCWACDLGSRSPVICLLPPGRVSREGQGESNRPTLPVQGTEACLAVPLQSMHCPLIRQVTTLRFLNSGFLSAKREGWGSLPITAHGS